MVSVVLTLQELKNHFLIYQFHLSKSFPIFPPNHFQFFLQIASGLSFSAQFASDISFQIVVRFLPDCDFQMLLRQLHEFTSAVSDSLHTFVSNRLQFFQKSIFGNRILISVDSRVLEVFLDCNGFSSDNDDDTRLNNAQSF